MRALLVLLFMAVSIQWGFAQLNLNVSRGTLGTVIEQIKSQSKYQFFYDDKLAALPVENVKVNNVSIEDALNVILKGKNISYKVEDNIVYLSEKTATSQEGKQQGKERTITGVVSDDMGPLIGVNVLVKGTSNGCITDLDGNFTLTTTEGEFYQFNLSSCIRQQNSLTAQFVSFSLSNLANIFYPPQFLQ